MSEHDERALAEAYALGALDAPERKLFEAHLATCTTCRQAVSGAAVATQAIALTAPVETPPKGSGDRLLALYRQERASQAPRASNPTLAALFAVAALTVAGWGYYEHERVALLEKQVEDCHHERDVLDADDVKLQALAPQGGFKGAAQIAYSEKKGVAVLGRGLPAPPPGKVYKLWSIAGGPPVPMGAFKPGVFIDRSPGGADTKFAISEEDAPGDVKAPTRVVFLPG